MADRYWVGGAKLGEWTPTNTLPWRSTAGASFSGTQSGFVVTFTDLKGTIANGHYVYVNGQTNTTISSAITYTNSPTNTSGYFSVAASRTLSARGMCTHSSNTGVSVPVAADSVFFTAGSAYLSQEVIQSAPSAHTTTITNLNMDGFRGGAFIGTEYTGYYTITVTGTITWPFNTGAYGYAAITLNSGTTINNNGNTNIDSGGFLYNVSYLVNGTTPPANILAGSLEFTGAVNLSSRTISAYQVYARSGTTLTPGTSKLICQTYDADSNNAKTLYDVEALLFDSYVSFYAPLSGMTFNSITLPTTGINGYLNLTNATTKYLNVQAPDVFSNVGYSSQIDNSTITKSGGGSVMLQVSYVTGSTFLPANTFFTVGADFSEYGVYNNTNIRPSPSPLNFV